MKNDDLRAFVLEIDFLPSGEGGLTAAYHELVRLYRTTYEWYMEQKIGKRRAARWLRFTGASCGIAGASIPLISQSVPEIRLAVGYALLALGALLGLADRYLGYSAAWKRYIVAAARINGQLIVLQFEFASAGSHDDDKSWRLLRNYAETLGSLVADETDAWHVQLPNVASRPEPVLE